jgi:cell wall assembly regulator SMI1
MNWRQLILNAYKKQNLEGYSIVPVFHPPATQDEIYTIETNLDIKLSDELRELLFETNGIDERMSIGNEQQTQDLGNFIFNTIEIVEITTNYRNRALSTNIRFNDMYFIGTPHTDGIDFAFQKNNESIFAWFPIEQKFRIIAPNLEQFIIGWLSNDIAI